MHTILAIFLFACGASDAPPSGRPPAPVAVSVAEGGELDATWRYVGQVRALDDALLAAEADGRVERIPHREGARVAAGDGLVEVDSRVASAELRSARATAVDAAAAAELAEAEQARVRQLSGGVLSPQAIATVDAAAVRARASADAARANADRAAATLSRHVVRAPFDGVVASRLVSPGDFVRVGTPVMRLVASGQLEVVVDVGADVVGGLREGQSADLGRGATGTVVGVVPALDPATRTARVRIAVDDPPAWLLPGSTVDVALDVSAGTGVLAPRDAVVLGALESRVVKVVDGAAQPVVVKVVATAGDRVLLSGDLAAGDVLVTRGNERLSPGQPVEVQP